MAARDQSVRTRLFYEIDSAARLALASIRAHKLRSFLTLLGVIIGVASVVLVGAAIEGLGVYAEESTAKVFGSNTFYMAQVANVHSRKEFFDMLRRNKKIRSDDVRYLQTATGDQILYSPFDFKIVDVIHADFRAEDVNVQGCSAVMPELRDINLVDGRFFTEQEERSRLPVAVLGAEVRTKLFPNSAAIGRKVRITGIEFTVVGVQEALGSAFGRSLDNLVYIPFTVFARLWGTRDSIGFFAKARPGAGLALEDAIDVTRVALRTRQHTRPAQDDRFGTVTPDAIRSFIDQVLGMISAIVVPVTLISLVVGGIVIMNIMLVSVTERTHEIGLRKSLGARQSDIRMQFLIEAVVLAAVGGAIGVAIGAALTELLQSLFQISLRVSGGYVALALIVSSTVGIASGWYPARRAARLDPVAALRVE